MAISNEPIQSNDKKINAKIVALILVFTLVVSGILAYVFNIGDMKKKTAKFINPIFKKKSSKEVEEKKKIADDMERLELEKEKILQLQTKLDTIRTDLELREKELTERETELMQREEEIESLQLQLSQKVDDIKSISKLYENMDAQRAAQILTELDDVETVILILKNIKKEKTADILENMDPKTAAYITNKMLQ